MHDSRPRDTRKTMKQQHNTNPKAAIMPICACTVYTHTCTCIYVVDVMLFPFAVVFMGSERYKGENTFDSFISRHGGQANACTDYEKVDYIHALSQALPSAHVQLLQLGSKVITRNNYTHVEGRTGDKAIYMCELS